MCIKYNEIKTYINNFFKRSSPIVSIAFIADSLLEKILVRYILHSMFESMSRLLINNHNNMKLFLFHPYSNQSCSLTSFPSFLSKGSSSTCQTFLCIVFCILFGFMDIAKFSLHFHHRFMLNYGIYICYTIYYPILDHQF